MVGSSEKKLVWGLLNTTVSNEEESQRLVEKLMQTQCVACIHISSVSSVYCWEGQQVRTSEILLSMKIPMDQFSVVKECISRHHPYQIPEVILLPIVSMSESYSEWLGEQIA
ncbi:MAG: divalent-cation tolerance protein CutA [Gammaproteobacteria bacterium]|nr:divalent-cation tolerance protein CutA [Gammaproteobacteria bacterium]